MEEREFSIVDVAFGGQGVGRIDGMACFVKGVIDGEKVKVRLRKKKKQFLEADLVEVLEPSPQRQEAPCPYFLKCGGCTYQHIDYSHQLRLKEKQLRDALQRIGGIAHPPVATIIPSPEPFHYRNRVTVHVREGEVGFFREKENIIVSIDRCLLASQEVNQALSKLRTTSANDGDYLLAEKKRYGGFRQVNNSVAALLLEEVCHHATNGEYLIDAYCGAGFFAHALASRFQKVIGIERSQGAVALAQKEASDHEEFLEGSVEELLPEALAMALEGSCTLILDPPSEGISQHVIHAILEKPPTKLIYVSCNPATLARDIKRLSDSYQLTTSVPLDMFPQTAEIESVNVFRLRTDSSLKI